MFSMSGIRRLSIYSTIVLLNVSTPILASEQTDNYNVTKTAAISVDEMINLAFQNNPNVTSSLYNVNAAESEVSAARNQFLPTPNISYGNGNKGRDNFSASLTQPLWTGGKLTSSLEYAKARVKSAENSVYEVKYKLALSIIDLWRIYQSKVAEEKVTLQTLSRYQHYQNIITNRIAGGRSSQADLTFIRSRVMQAESDLATIMADKVTALNNLSRVVGVALDAKYLTFSYPLNEKSYPLDKYLERSIEYSPTLKRLYSDILVASRQADVKRANLFPNINLVASREQYNNNNGSVTDNKVMVNIQYTPGAGFTSYYDYDNSTQRIGILKYNLESEKIYLRNDIYSTIVSLNSALSRINLVKNQSTENNKVLESYTRQFEFGQKTWIDLLNAARELNLSEISYAQLQSSIASYEWKLKIYTGEYNKEGLSANE